MSNGAASCRLSLSQLELKAHAGGQFLRDYFSSQKEDQRIRIIIIIVKVEV